MSRIYVALCVVFSVPLAVVGQIAVSLWVAKMVAAVATVPVLAVLRKALA